MNSFPGKRSSKSLSTGLTVLASFALVILLGDRLDTALAADDPAATSAKSSQSESLDIPGSFKDLADAKDRVTAKRSAGQIEPLSSSKAGSIEVEIDTTKGATLRSEAFTIGDLQDFHATAYCLKGRTASGVSTRPGVIAADPRVLPLGTVVHIRAGRYTGTYTVLDTGGRIKGRRVDVYVPTHKEAMEFGRRQVKIKVIGRRSGKADRASKSFVASAL